MGNTLFEILEIAKRFIDCLQQQGISVEQAFLYGSYARGDAHDDSDIDIVVVSKDFSKNMFEDNLWLAKLRRSIDIRISARAYHPNDFTFDNIIPSEAMTHGIRIA